MCLELLFSFFSVHVTEITGERRENALLCVRGFTHTSWPPHQVSFNKLQLRVHYGIAVPSNPSRDNLLIP